MVNIEIIQMNTEVVYLNRTQHVFIMYKIFEGEFSCLEENIKSFIKKDTIFKMKNNLQKPYSGILLA